jgi:signal transduction histidine kinase
VTSGAGETDDASRLLQRGGIVDALRVYVDASDSDASVSVTSHLFWEPPHATSSIAFALVRATLDNAIELGHAREIDVLIRQVEDGVYLRIADDGLEVQARHGVEAEKGLDPSEVRLWAQLAGGWSHILSAPTSGTIVEIWLPFATAPTPA